MTYQLGRILIRCTEAIAIASPDVADCWYEFVGGSRYLRLWLGLGEYAPIVEERSLDFIDTTLSAIAPISSARIGFTAQVNHKEMAIRDIVRRIVKAQTSADGRSFSPAIVLDFCEPEEDDARFTQSGQTYTVRRGRLFPPESKGGSIEWDGKRYGEGFSLRFMENQKRRMS